MIPTSFPEFNRCILPGQNELFDVIDEAGHAAIAFAIVVWNKVSVS